MSHRTLGSIAATSLLALSLWAVPGAGPASAAGCTSSPVTDQMNVTVTAAPDIQAWDELRVNFGGSISDGHCAGDSFTFQIPEGLTSAQGNRVELKDPNGNVVAVMTISGQTATVTLTDFVETHRNVQISGWFEAQVRDVVSPGETWTTTWDVNGKSTTNVDFGECPDCTLMPTEVSKFGRIVGDTVLNVITFPTSTSANQLYTWKDTLSGNHSFICPANNLVRGISFTGRDEWGQPTGRVQIQVPVTSCTDTEIRGRLTSSAAGLGYRIFIDSAVTGPGPYTDRAVVTTGGETDGATAEVIERDLGGEGSGDTLPTETTTTTPPATETTTTTPPATETTSTTPATETSTTPGTATTSPTTPSTSTTGTMTTPATTTTTSPNLPHTGGYHPQRPQTSHLPETGTENTAVIGLAGGAMVLGGAVLLLASRRRASSHTG